MKGDIDILICQLRDGRAPTRAAAARSLSETPSPLARKDLLRCLNDTDDDVRYWATVALSGLDEERLIGRIAAQLDDPAASVRMVAAKVLAQRPFRGAVPSLLRCLEDADPNVAHWAGQALWSLGDFALPQLVASLADSSWKRRSGAARVLERMGRPAIPYLVRALTRDDPDLRYWALRLLGALRATDALETLTAFLRSPERDLVIAAAQALGAIADRRAIPDLIQQLAHPDEGARNACVDALARLPDSAVHELTQLLASNQRLTRLSSSLALAAAGETSLKPLLEKLSVDSSETRFWVVKALERLGHPIVVPILEELVDDEQPEVALAAAQAMGSFELSKETALQLVDRLDAESWRLRQALCRSLSAQRHLPPALFARPLESGSEHQRFWLTKVLGHIGTTEVVPMLVSRFEDASWPIRKNAAASISRIGTPAIPYVLDVLKIANLDANIRFWATKALTGIAEPRLLPTLLELLGDSDASIRTMAAEAIERLGGAAVPGLLEALKGSRSRPQREGISRCLTRVGTRQVETIAGMFQFRDAEVSYWIVQALAHMGEPAHEPLERLLEDPDDRMRRLALTALPEMGGERAVRLLIERLDDRSLTVRRMAVSGLAKMRAPEAVKPLISMLDSLPSDLVPDVVQALGDLGDPSATAAIMRYLGHERWDIRRTAIDAVGRIGGPEARGMLTQMLRQERTGDMVAPLARAVGRVGATEAVPALIRLVGGDEDVTVAALEALGSLKATDAVPAVLELLSHETWSIRRAALQTLGHIGQHFDLELLKPILAGEDLLLRHEARETLKALMGPRRWDDMLALQVKKSLREPADELYAQAVAAAGEKKPDAALKLLRKALRLSKKPEYFGLLGSIHLEQRNMNQAIRYLRRAVHDSKDVQLAFKLAVAYMIHRDLRRALAAFRQVLRIGGAPAAMMQTAMDSIQKLQKELKA